MSKLWRVIFLNIFFVPWLFLSNWGQGTPSLEENSNLRNSTLVLGGVCDNPEKHYSGFKSILDYAVSLMKDVGIERGKVYFASSQNELRRAIKEGKVDWATIDPTFALVLKGSEIEEIILRRWRNGVPQFNILFFVKRGSSISSINQINGKRIAFESRDSASGYVLPMAALRKRNLILKEMKTSNQKGSDQSVGYVFSGAPLNTVAFVAKGLADVGVMSDLDWEDESNVPFSIKEKLQIIEQAGPFDQRVEVIRRNLNPTIKNALIQILAHPPLDPSEIPSFQDFEGTTRFEEIDLKIQKRLDELSRLMEVLRPNEVFR
jgi:phosphonate transport system substrate-binding protein